MHHRAGQSQLHNPPPVGTVGKIDEFIIYIF